MLRKPLTKLRNRISIETNRIGKARQIAKIGGGKNTVRGGSQKEC